MRIKVTGYIETDDLDEDSVDLEHETGLSEEAFLAYSTGAEPLYLDDPEFTKVEAMTTEGQGPGGRRSRRPGRLDHHSKNSPSPTERPGP